MGRRSGLGKGLSALIPEGAVADAAPGALPTFAEIPIEQVRPNPHQPRVHFDEETLAELAASIAAIGVLQPILVRASADGHYQLVAGERRWRAAKRAGMTTIPALVRGEDAGASSEDLQADLGLVEQALVENVHREDLTPLEEAAAYQQLLEEFQLTHDQIAGRVGRSRSTITNTLRLLSLPPAVQRLLADGKLSAGHARALLGTPDRVRQEALAQRASDEGWSVRSVEQAVRESGAVPPPVDGAGPGAGAPAAAKGVAAPGLRPPGLLELEQLLADHLETRVGVQMTAKRGKVTIDFADLADLERIYRRITGEG